MSVVMVAIFVNSNPIVGDEIATGEDFQSIRKLGTLLLNEYMVPFEFASILLLVAMIGVVLLSKKEKTTK
jgi:NADH-quinone oxidoreductase subunit J